MISFISLTLRRKFPYHQMIEQLQHMIVVTDLTLTRWITRVRPFTSLSLNLLFLFGSHQFSHLGISSKIEENNI
jgi:hypothetical protein